MTARLHKLPVTRPAMPGESGMSLLLRTATANGLSLHALREQAGISAVRPLAASDAVRIAPALGMRVTDLEQMLISKGRHQDGRALRYQGHVFVRTGFLRTRKPQVCPICIHRNDYCNAVWDSAFYTVCHIHNVPLIDQCSVCSSSLTWYRPAIDVCRCHAYLKIPKHADNFENDKSSRLSAWIASRFDGLPAFAAGTVPWPKWLSELSVDGLCSIIHAFGVCNAPYQRVLAKMLIKGSGSSYWNEVAARGIDRLQRFVVHPSEQGKLKSLIWEGGLEGIALRFVQEPDGQVAQLLLQQAFGTQASGKFGSQRAALSQLPLF